MSIKSFVFCAVAHGDDILRFATCGKGGLGRKRHRDGRGKAAAGHTLVGSQDLAKARAEKLAAAVLAQRATADEVAAMARLHAAATAKNKALADLAAAAKEAS